MNEGFRLDQLFHSRPKGVFFLILLSWWQTIYFVLKSSVFFRRNYHCHMQFYCLSLVTTKQCGTNYCTTAPFNNKWTLKFKEAIVCRALWMARMDIVWNLTKKWAYFFKFWYLMPSKITSHTGLKSTNNKPWPLPFFFLRGLLRWLTVACEQAIRGTLGAGREKEGELATASRLPISLWLPLTFRQSPWSGNKYKCKQTLKNKRLGQWHHY